MTCGRSAGAADALIGRLDALPIATRTAVVADLRGSGEAQAFMPAFNQTLLKRFVNLMGLFPVGNLVRLSTDELAVVIAHPRCERPARAL